MKTIWNSLLLFGALMLFSASATAGNKTETIKNPASDTPEGAVAAALAAGLAGDFNAYLATVHPEHKSTKSQIKQRRKYEWSRFTKQAAWYVSKRTPLTFQVTQRRPEGKSLYRLFIKDQTHKDRMPVPVRLKKSGNAWKIVTNSL